MARTSIVTDSTSGLNPEEARALGIAMIPVHIKIDGQEYREGIELSLSEFQRMVESDSVLPRLSPPTLREFHALYRELAQESNEIVAVHVSSRLNGTVNTARQAAHSFSGRARITVVDSRLIATPLAWLAKAAAEAASAGVDTPEIVRLLRAMIPHMYIAFSVDSPPYLRRVGTPQRAATASASTPPAKPLLMVEEGEIMPLERSRSKGRAVERLFEFVAEFSRIEHLAILQSRPSPEALELATLINEEFPEQSIETETYPASVAAYVGVDALGVAVYEGLG